MIHQMLKEEEYRHYIRNAFDILPQEKPKLLRLTTALIRAVQEDCAKVAESKIYSTSDVRSDKYNDICCEIAAAIRGAGKEKGK